MKQRGWWSKGMAVGAAASMALLSACGGSGSSSSPSPDAAATAAPATEAAAASPAGGGGGATGKPVNLSIMWWGPDARHQATLKALDQYKAQHPNVSFTPEYLAWDGYWSKLPTLAASKSMTDVLQMDAAYIQEYAQRGTLVDLSGIDLKGVVDDKVLNNLKIDGKLYGIPLSLNAQGYAYNKAELEAAGVPLPKKDWTWEEFFQWGRDARAKLPAGKYPLGDTTTWDIYQYYQLSMGKGPVMQDGGTKLNLDKDTFITFYKTFEEFRKTKVVPPAEMSASFVENDPKADPMGSGVVMTRGASVGSVSVLEGLLPGKVGVVNVPVGPSGGGWAQSTIFLSVSKDSKNPEEAKKFVEWFIKDPEAGKILGLTRGIPINPEIYKQLEPSLQPKDKLGKDLYEVAKDKAMPFYGAAAGWSEFVDKYKAEMDSVTFGKTTVEQAYDRIVKLGNSIADKVKAGKK